MLYHGTNFSNLIGILTKGLVPSGGYSRHRTKTRNAIFLTDSMDGAFGYAKDYRGAIILEINTTNLPIEPDYDDVGDKLDKELDEINSEFGTELEIGSVVSDELEIKIEEYQEQWGSESGTPPIISIEDNKLYAEPYVFFSIDDSELNDNPEVYDYDSEILFSDGTPGIVIRQWLCLCQANIFDIKYIWLDENVIKEIGIDKSYAQSKSTVIDYWEIVGTGEEADFRKVEMFAFLPHHLAAIL